MSLLIINNHCAIIAWDKWNNMSAIFWTSMHTASNRSTALPKLWQSFFLSQMWAKLQTPAMESGDGKFCGCADGDWTHVSSFPGRCANHYTTAPWYQVYQICSFQSSMAVAVGVATHVVITTVLSHCESATYTVV